MHPLVSKIINQISSNEYIVEMKDEVQALWINTEPERSKREDKCAKDFDLRHECPWYSICRDSNHGCGAHLMRCSEHCGNTVSPK